MERILLILLRSLSIMLALKTARTQNFSELTLRSGPVFLPAPHSVAPMFEFYFQIVNIVLF